MKNVLIVATTSYAGMGPYVTEIVNSFYANDNVYYFFRDYEDDFFKKNIKQELKAKSTFYTLPNSKWNKIKDLVSSSYPFNNDIIALCIQKNVYLVHFINNPGSKALVKVLEKKGVKCVSTVHDLHPHEARKSWYKMVRWGIINKRLRKDLDYDTNLITNSKGQYEELKNTYPNKNIFFHSFPSLVTKTIIEGNDIPKELLNNNIPYILFFGRIEEYKGIRLLYNAFTQTPDLCDKYKLVIAGKGEIPFIKSGIDKNVITVNRYIKDTEIKYMYEKARCVVYPYISATQSGVLSLAFYFKVPTLTSDIPFFKGIIGELNDKRMLFQNGNIADLAKKLITILNDDCTDMINKEEKYYKGHYDSAAIRKELLAIYDSI